MEQNSSSQMGRFCSQWLLEIRFSCRDSENSSDSGIQRFKLLKRQCCCNHLVSSKSIKKVNGRENVIIDQIWSVLTKLLPLNE